MNTHIVFPACNATGWTSSFLSREGYAEPNTQLSINKLGKKMLQSMLKIKLS